MACPAGAQDAAPGPARGDGGGRGYRDISLALRNAYKVRRGRRHGRIAILRAIGDANCPDLDPDRDSPAVQLCSGQDRELDSVRAQLPGRS